MRRSNGVACIATRDICDQEKEQKERVRRQRGHDSDRASQSIAHPEFPRAGFSYVPKRRKKRPPTLVSESIAIDKKGDRDRVQFRLPRDPSLKGNVQTE